MASNHKYNQIDPVVAGTVRHDMLTSTYKIFDGEEWHPIDNPIDMHSLDSNIDDVLTPFLARKHITDEFLEGLYPDLKELREQYEILADKYRVFELLKRTNKPSDPFNVIQK